MFLANYNAQNVALSRILGLIICFQIQRVNRLAFNWEMLCLYAIKGQELDIHLCSEYKHITITRTFDTIFAFVRNRWFRVPIS